MSRIQRALLSVYDKTGLVPFARTLIESGVELISTGGTAKALRAEGLPVTDLSEVTGFPEMLDGRVKTLHPKIHGGLLYVRGNADHEAAVAAHGIQPIDLVVVNLYPFEKTVAKPGVTLDEAIENIDIGGPSMLRSAAKNHASVTVIVDPSDYAEAAAQIKSMGGTTLELRRKLAARVYARTSAYDASIATHLIKTFRLSAGLETVNPDRAAPATSVETADEVLPPVLDVRAERVALLRYGENPHQKAALYGGFNDYFQQIHGKELSYNNILDLTAAAQLIGEFSGDSPTLAILKHTNPCGVGRADSLAEAWNKALATDRQAPFGGIIAVNRPLDLACAEAIAEIFSEVIIAPEFDEDAAALLQRKKNLRLLRILESTAPETRMEMRGVGAGSWLVQEGDVLGWDMDQAKVVSRRQPTDEEWEAMAFGWRVMKHVKSNAILYSGRDRTLGIGAGQMSRVDASRIAVWKAGESGLSLKGSVVCSDAFFPFADGLEAAAAAGAGAAVQPGGSKRDAEVIAAADAHGMAMVFTGVRHFRH
jgi:phosphoribosylaminoimidazolecarboxamide formyltransferase/IMP cyclohydrolase